MQLNPELRSSVHTLAGVSGKCLVLLIALSTLIQSSAAQELRPLKELDGVGIFENLGGQVSGDLNFRDHTGDQIEFDALLQEQNATILTLNYANCPMLCNQQLTGLVNAMKEFDEIVGQDYQIVTVSINPEETPEAAADVRARYLELYGREDADWKFLVGDEKSIAALANSVGFGFNFVPETEEFAHTAALILLNPEGKITRYLYGIEYDPATVRLSLVETAAGEVRSTLDRIILACFFYDSKQGRYTPAILKLTRIGGTLTILALGVFVLIIKRRNKVKTVAETTPA